jgi:uncharacterized protein (DUF1330 family)
MSYYFIANIRINDEREYQKYIERSGEIFKKYNGEYLAVDDTPGIIEGYWDYTRIVLIRFNSFDDFSEWYNSSDYQEILRYRLSAAECDTLLVKGYEKS